MKPTSYLIFAILTAHSLCAQTAILRGQITDESGAVIPGATVSLSGAGTPKTTATDGTGAYTFAGLTPGAYSVQASAPELSMAQPAKVNLKAGAQVLNLTLHVATVA